MADMPVVADRIMLELANSLVVAEDLTPFRSEQSAIAALLARLTGRDRRRETLTARALVDGQKALVAWATELTGHAQVTDIVVGLVAEHLQQTRAELARADAHTAARLEDLADVVARVTEVCEQRFAKAESRLAALERQGQLVQLRLAAEESLELSVSRWSAGRSYSQLPWLLQVVLLSREVATGPAGRNDHLTGSDAFQERLIHRILQAPRTMGLPRDRFTLAELIDESYRDMDDPKMLHLVAEVLGSGLEPSLAIPAGPLSSALTVSAELASLPGPARLERPAETALALVRRRGGALQRTTSRREVARRLAAEQFEAVRRVRDRLVLPQIGATAFPPATSRSGGELT
ncbi:hypothetical protein [Streptomyces sp. NPDC050416]|uniref:hypothetical protein n=1 Tax=Streptomyces sp. NPDC050416 TaxID=3365611 RepID=UPI0037BC41B2